QGPTTVEDIITELKGLPIDEFFEESFKQFLLRDPQEITRLGLSKSFGLRNDQLNNFSDAYIRETQTLEAELLKLLRMYDRSALTKEQQISYDVYEWFLDDLVRGHEFRYYNYPVHHFLTSHHDNLTRFLTEVHPLTTKEDAEDYVSCLSQVGTQLEQIIKGLELREKTEVVLPKFIIEMTKNQIIRYLHLSEGSPIDGKSILLYTVFDKKLKKIDINTEEKQKMLDAALKEIEESVVPGYVHLLDYLKYVEFVATNDAGVWKFPKGNAYYCYMLRKATSTDLTPEQIHEIGLKEVERIQKEMRTIFDELGYPKDAPLHELMERVAADGGFIDTDPESGKDQVVKTYECILDEVSQNVDRVFDVRPSAELVVVGDTMAGGGGGFFVHGSVDGSRPGAFHTAVASSLVYKYRMPTIAYHEAIPGHYFQISIAQELDLPLFRNVIVFNGYAEGWALYTERLAWELGLFESNPYGNIGRLQFELLRAVRLVLDTGIHAMKWTRKEAKQYMKDTLGSDMYLHEVDRFIVLPGQATGYKVGMIKIVELREKAMDALGDHFDIKEFHRVVLGNGSMPLEVLERLVQDYIDANRGKAGGS
ncbi:MAG: DUF885 domain-containing protein, partial [Theionarchaea archaeon]|nr:DUF885 domain-containing protein [Theionarchaea archaeon]